MSQRPNTYRRLLGYLKPYSWRVAVAYSSVIMAILLMLIVPQVVKRAIDEGLATGSARALFIAAGVILGLATMRALIDFLQRYFGEWLTHRVAFDLRNSFYDHVQRLPFSFHDRTLTGEIMSRATSDISETETFIGIGLLDMLSAALVLIGVIVAMLLESLTLGAIALVTMPFLVYATIRFGRTVRPRFKGIQEQLGKLSTTMQESLTGIQVVKAFARDEYELEKFDGDNNRWFSLRYGLIRVWANNWPFFTFMLAVSSFILLVIGVPQVLENRISVGSLFAMFSYVAMLDGPVQRLGFLVNLAATAGASATRVFEILDAPSEIEEIENPFSPERVTGRVDFRKVGFKYGNDRAVLNEVSFAVEPGQTVALIGASGSGKSTLINLIPRFYDASEGLILIDGVDITKWKLDSLRGAIGIVMQDSILFSSTIAENISYGRGSASHEEIVAAARAAQASQFIEELPLGYETVVGERGVTLSGGQRQRVAIARALLTDPRILILDDSTSSVDTQTEHHIQQALSTLMEGRTTFVIAQRLLTLKNADMILVLSGGRIVERGRHDELLSHGGLYQVIYDLQLKDQEELAELVTHDEHD